MSDPESFDIEDLSLVLQRRADLEGATPPPALHDEDLTLRIEIDPATDDDSDVESTVHIVDTLTQQERPVYRFAQGCYLRYRLAILGIGEAAEAIYDQLRARLMRTEDLLIDEHNIWARYDVGLFGGHPRDGGVVAADAERLADRLARFRPNFLVVVNAGAVKKKFADHTAHELALLSHRINAGATVGGQRPYDLVLVSDSPIPAAVFARYQHTCQRMNTFAASLQCGPGESSRISDHARSSLARHAERYLRLR